MTNICDLTRPNQPFEQFIADRVKQLRISKKITVLELAKILDINERQMYKHESGKFWISAGRLLLIAKALDVPITYFYQGFSNRYVSMVLKNTLGSRIKSARLIAGLSIKEVSRKLNITTQQLYNYENDIAIPNLRNAIEMTQIYNIDLNAFSNIYNEKSMNTEIVNDEKPLSPNVKPASELPRDLLFYEEKNHGELIGESINESQDGWSFKSTYKFLKNKLRG